ncbi:MAG: hypothetical protein M1839_005791 [Geoglossum umbratile]|nr:MAG: hypothetical protein M1839_005791 [Geoglossum umbratile]
MLFRVSAALLLWISIASSSPLTKRLQVPDNTDIYVPDGNGNLVKGPIAASPDGTPAPFDVVYQNDGACDGRTQSGGSGLFSIKVQFCNQQTAIVYGPAVKISPDIDCVGLASCAQTHTQSFTTTSSFAINGGIDVPLATEAIKVTAKLAVTKTWTDSSTQSDAFTFTPKPGAKGHMVFFPYIQKACGYAVQTKQLIPLSPFFPYSPPEISNYDAVSCGSTPLLLSNGQPDGVYSFCDIKRLAPGNSYTREITDPLYDYREERQTAMHLLMKCGRFKDLRRQELSGIPGRSDLRAILNGRKAVTKAINFMEQTQILGQFRIIELTKPSTGEIEGMTTQEQQKRLPRSLIDSLKGTKHFLKRICK